MNLELSHHEMTKEMVETAYSWLKKRLSLTPDDEDYAEIKPGDMIKLLDTMMKAQRVSLGLPAHGLSGSAASDGAPSLAASIEVTMRQNAEGSEVHKEQEKETDIRELLSSPDDILAAQELIIKFSAAQEGGRKRGEGHFLDRFEDVDDG
jgi:hypothetical protein